jgi:hypothetical protein
MNMKTYDNILELASLKRCHISQKKKNSIQNIVENLKIIII